MLDIKKYNQAATELSANLYRFVLKSLKDKAASQDIVQDCYLSLWVNRDKIDPLKIKSWLFTTAYHKLINYLKKESKLVGFEQDWDHSSPVLTNTNFDAKEIIDQALDQLPPLQKAVILLRDLEGYNYDEIGAILEISSAQVRVYLFRGRQKMKNMIKSINELI